LEVAVRPYLQTGAFWSGAAERCAKTIAQVVLALLTVDASTSVFAIDWKTTAGIALTAGFVSVLTSVVSGPIGPPGSPSMVNDRSRPNPDVAV
jgi:hypothetical protein